MAMVRSYQCVTSRKPFPSLHPARYLCVAASLEAWVETGGQLCDVTVVANSCCT
uniref:Uncharacterized protein n=1 Tax=Physcomitrium patens TaxID=3218 RepID=A0A2K1JTZ2_PHYPA|nr:hypothetical protein PHYPA_014771 [Physcomitrium patens]